MPPAHFWASSFLFIDIKKIEIFNLQKVGQGVEVEFSQ